MTLEDSLIGYVIRKIICHLIHVMSPNKNRIIKQNRRFLFPESYVFCIIISYNIFLHRSMFITFSTFSYVDSNYACEINDSMVTGRTRRRMLELLPLRILNIPEIRYITFSFLSRLDLPDKR